MSKATVTNFKDLPIIYSREIDYGEIRGRLTREYKIDSAAKPIVVNRYIDGEVVMTIPRVHLDHTEMEQFVAALVLATRYMQEAMNGETEVDIAREKAIAAQREKTERRPIQRTNGKIEGKIEAGNRRKPVDSKPKTKTGRNAVVRKTKSKK